MSIGTSRKPTFESRELRLLIPFKFSVETIANCIIRHRFVGSTMAIGRQLIMDWLIQDLNDSTLKESSAKQYITHRAEATRLVYEFFPEMKEKVKK